MDTEYRRRSIENVIAAGPQPSEDFFRMKVIGEGSSHWMNLSETELSAIGAVLAGSRFVLTIDTGNAAMSTHEDVADALERAAGAIRLRAESPDNGMVMDVNGNKVGEWHLPALPPEE